MLQRFDSALRLNVHAHTIAPDGVYVRDTGSGELTFHPLATLSHEHVVRVASRTAARVRKVLKKHGRFDEYDCYVRNEAEPEGDQQVLLSFYQAAAQGRDLFSQQAPRPTLHLVSSQHPTRTADDDRDKLLARVHGISIHAATCLDGRDRKRLQRLCQYISRPALAQDRLHILDDGRVRHDMKRTWADGTEAIVLEPFDFIARLCALGPPPYFNLTRFHGVFAPNTTLRAQVVVEHRTLKASHGNWSCSGPTTPRLRSTGNPPTTRRPPNRVVTRGRNFSSAPSQSMCSCVVDVQQR